MNIIAYFTSGGTPIEGLSPVLSANTLDGTLVVSGESMSSVSGGFYYYNFTGYNYTTDYVFQAHESSLPEYEQYSIGTSEAAIVNDAPIIKQVLGLSQNNFVMVNQTYDGDGRLLTSNMYTYPTSGDTINDTNREHEYLITSVYDVNGNLINYRVVEL